MRAKIVPPLGRLTFVMRVPLMRVSWRLWVAVSMLRVVMAMHVVVMMVSVAMQITVRLFGHFVSNSSRVHFLVGIFSRLGRWAPA